MSGNTFFWLSVAIWAIMCVVPFFLRRREAQRDHRWMR